MLASFFTAKVWSSIRRGSTKIFFVAEKISFPPCWLGVDVYVNRSDIEDSKTTLGLQFLMG
jgi:hypothetical protein